MERKVLGRGLEALIPKKPGATLVKDFCHLPLDKIRPARCQPRQGINEIGIQVLAKSIQEKGFIQPILVRKIKDGNYEVVAGERRYQAAKSLGLKEIPTIIRELEDKDAFILAIIENLQRKDLDPIEEAHAFQRLLGEFGFFLEDVARLVGKDKTTVANCLRLLKLPDKIQRALRQGLISRTQARTILAAAKLQDQEKLFQQILKEGLSVREIEKKVRLVARKKKPIDPFVMGVEEDLERSLGTRVKIFNKKNNRGKIVVEYYSLKDLERIIKKLT